MQSKPLLPREYLFALVPYMKKGQWALVRKSLEKRRDALKKSGENQKNLVAITHT